MGGVFSISSRSLLDPLLDSRLRDLNDLKNDEPLFLGVSGLAEDLGLTKDFLHISLFAMTFFESLTVDTFCFLESVTEHALKKSVRIRYYFFAR